MGMIKRDSNSNPPKIPSLSFKTQKKYLDQWNINFWKILHPYLKKNLHRWWPGRLPYFTYGTGMCSWTGYGFLLLCPIKQAPVVQKLDNESLSNGWVLRKPIALSIGQWFTWWIALFTVWPFNPSKNILWSRCDHKSRPWSRVWSLLSPWSRLWEGVMRVITPVITPKTVITPVITPKTVITPWSLLPKMLCLRIVHIGKEDKTAMRTKTFRKTNKIVRIKH